MSKETLEFLRANVRVGYADERPDGPAWWRNAGEYMTDGTHFSGPVPAEEVQKLLNVPFVEAEFSATYRRPVLNKDGSPKVELTEVDGEPQFIPVTEDVTVTDPTRKVIVSADDGFVHGIFRQGWQLHGYQQWTADQLAAILDQARGELGVMAVGRLAHRSVAFIQAKLEGTGLEVGGYAFTPYIGAATSVNGSLSSTYATGVTGWVCDNTLLAGLQSAQSILKVKHSRNSAGKLADVRNYLGLVYQAGDDFAAFATALQSVDVSAKEFTAWLDETAPVPPADPKSSTGGIKYTNAVKYRDKLTQMYAYDAKVRPWAGTAFGVFQLDNTYRTWERGVKGADGGRMERNLLNIADGTTASEDGKALAVLGKVLDGKLAAALAG
jgi:phage/plasmid-like protein (TIGR03299 family)